MGQLDRNCKTIFFALGVNLKTQNYCACNVHVWGGIASMLA